MLQTFARIVLVPVALITWACAVRTHHLGFGPPALLALLMMSVACVGLATWAAPHPAGPGGLVGLVLVGRFRELVLTHRAAAAWL